MTDLLLEVPAPRAAGPRPLPFPCSWDCLFGLPRRTVVHQEGCSRLIVVVESEEGALLAAPPPPPFADPASPNFCRPASPSPPPSSPSGNGNSSGWHKDWQPHAPQHQPVYATFGHPPSIDGHYGHSHPIHPPPVPPPPPPDACRPAIFSRPAPGDYRSGSSAFVYWRRTGLRRHRRCQERVEHHLVPSVITRSFPPPVLSGVHASSPGLRPNCVTRH